MLQVFKVKLSNEKRDICMYIDTPKKHYLKQIKLNWSEINQTFKKITIKIEHGDFSKLKASILVKMFMDIYIMEMKKTFDQPEVCFMANIAQPQSENLDFG